MHYIPRNYGQYQSPYISYYKIYRQNGIGEPMELYADTYPNGSHFHVLNQAMKYLEDTIGAKKWKYYRQDMLTIVNGIIYIIKLEHTIKNKEQTK